MAIQMPWDDFANFTVMPSWPGFCKTSGALKALRKHQKSMSESRNRRVFEGLDALPGSRIAWRPHEIPLNRVLEGESNFPRLEAIKRWVTISLNPSHLLQTRLPFHLETLATALLARRGAESASLLCTVSPTQPLTSHQ